MCNVFYFLYKYMIFTIYVLVNHGFRSRQGNGLGYTAIGQGNGAPFE